MNTYTLVTPAVALAAATPITAAQLRAIGAPALLTSLSVSLDGTDASSPTPVLVRLARQTVDGTFTSLAAVKHSTTAAAATTTGHHTATVEPTTPESAVLGQWYLRHDGGLMVLQFGLEEAIVVAAGEALGVRLNAPAVVNASVSLTFAEL